MYCQSKILLLLIKENNTRTVCFFCYRLQQLSTELYIGKILKMSGCSNRQQKGSYFIATCTTWIRSKTHEIWRSKESNPDFQPLNLGLCKWEALEQSLLGPQSSNPAFLPRVLASVSNLIIYGLLLLLYKALQIIFVRFKMWSGVKPDFSLTFCLPVLCSYNSY